MTLMGKKLSKQEKYEKKVAYLRKRSKRPLKRATRAKLRHPKVKRVKQVPLPKLGKRGKINIEANKELRELFWKRGTIWCEVGIQGKCKINEMLSFAHRHKRRWYYGRSFLLENWKQVILACIPCHQVIEKDAKLTEEIFQRLRGNEDTT